MTALRSGSVSRPILVGHSGAGPLLPAIRREADRAVAGYIFVDAGLPKNGELRAAAGPFAQQLRELYAARRHYPDWTDTDLRQALPDPAWRKRLLSELRPQPLSYWEEPIPVFAGWPDAPCGYLRFGRNPAYDEAAQAHQRGWPYIEIPGQHFHMLVDPAAVATALVELVNQMTAP